MDEDRRVILARRARFLAAAVAGAGLAAGTQSCASDQKPQGSPPRTEIVVPEADGGPEESTDAELPPRAAAPEAAPPPRDPYPRICLSEY